MAISYLEELNDMKDTWMVQVRVCRLWESTNPQKNDELISLDMIFIDQKEHLIHAVIRSHLVPRFKHLLSEGSLYSIRNIKVVANMGNYKPVSSEFKILFLAITSVKKLEEEVANIPLHGFQFIQPDVLESRVNDNSILSDVVGSLCGVGNIDIVGNGYKKRDIRIITNYSVTTTITLWGKLGETFDPDVYKKDGGPYILIITSIMVKRFQGEINFSSTNATKVYTNLPIPIVTSLSERFLPLSKDVKIVESSRARKILPEEEMFINRMKVKELVEAVWSEDLMEAVVTLRARIIEILDNFGWYYVSCKSCLKRVIIQDGVYICKACHNKPIEYPLVLFKVHAKVEDDTGVTTVVLFNMIVERLLDTSAKKLLNDSSSSDKHAPTEIQSLVGKDFIYKLKLTKYNLREGYENYTASQVFEPNEELEKGYEQKKIKKDNKELEDFEEFEERDTDTNPRKKRLKKQVVVDDEDAD